MTLTCEDCDCVLVTNEFGLVCPCWLVEDETDAWKDQGDEYQ